MTSSFALVEVLIFAYWAAHLRAVLLLLAHINFKCKPKANP